jgi:hypothetical protein
MKRYLTLLLAWGLLVSGFLSAGNKAAAQTFPANLTGSYEADLILSSVTYGKIDFTVNAKGLASGKLAMPNGKSYSFSAQLAVDGGSAFKNMHVVVKGPFPLGPQNLQMNLRVYTDGSITGATQSMIAGIPPFMSMANGVRLASFTGKGDSVAPWQGLYTMAFSEPTPAGAGVPTGSGYASATVLPNGQMKLAGKLADGTTLSATLKPTVNGVYRLLALPYKTGGFFSAELAFTQGDDDRYRIVGGEAIWQKSANPKDKTYRAGFGPVVLDVNAEPWIKPGTGETLPGILGASGKQIDFSLFGAGLDAEGAYLGQFPAKLEISIKNELLPVFGDAFAPTTAAAWAKLWKVKVNPGTGVYTGTLSLRELIQTPPVGSGSGAKYTPVKFVTRKIAIEGVLLRDFNNASEPFRAEGFFLLPPLVKTEPSTTGGVEADGPLEPVGTGGPVIGAISPGTPGTYTMNARLLSSSVELPGGLPITVTGSMKNVPAAGASVSFTIAPDLSHVIFNGRKVPLVSDSRPTGLLFSDASAKNYKNTLTVTVHLDTTTGRPTGVSAMYVQLLAAKAFGHTAYYPGVNIYDTASAPVKTQ